MIGEHTSLSPLTNKSIRRDTSLVGYTVLGLFSLLTLFPVFTMVTVFLLPARNLSSDLYHLWPNHIALSNFVTMWTTLPVGRLLLNSLIIAGGSTLLSLLVGIPAAFALARTPVYGRRLWLFVFLATQLFSPSIIIVSAYHVMALLHLTDSYFGLIILDAGFYCLPFVIWIIAGNMRQIPQEVEDAVDIDGASGWTKLWRIFVPMATPSIIVALVYAFIQSWNDFAFALTLATSTKIMPLPIGVYSFMGAYQIQWNYLMGASIVATVPILILFLIVQRRLIAGFMNGSIR